MNNQTVEVSVCEGEHQIGKGVISGVGGRFKECRFIKFYCRVSCFLVRKMVEFRRIVSVSCF